MSPCAHARMRRERLTQTQRIILEIADKAPVGIVAFGAADRRGTRLVRRDDYGTPWINAYSMPWMFLERRGLLSRANAPYHYRITDAGRAAIAAGSSEESQPRPT